ncbi:MAG: Holliday junction resolvase RecU [Acholeplasma sp.]|nr:Holliday junction resolvase RecU [Acholeplasma sp.]
MKYPIKRKSASIQTSYSNLGMTLESDIETTNNYYLNQGIAVIYKKPTPIQVVNVDYPARNKAKIVEAYYKTPSTTDFNGIYKGKYIDFDAKETKSKTSFPLKNIHPHQIEHLKNVRKHGGIAFLIINWRSYNKYFFLPIDVILEYWDQMDTSRKSIPYQTFIDRAHEIKFSFHPRLDYLKIIDEHYINNVPL